MCIRDSSGEGKTTLFEAMLFNSGVIERMGKVENGTTVSDFDEQEIARKMSVSLSVASITWKDVKVNLIDVPVSYTHLLPQTNFLGISRKITDPAVRERLLKEADKLREKGAGFIVRTAAEEADRRHLKIESEYLKRIWRSVQRSAQSAAVGDVVHREYDRCV